MKRQEAFTLLEVMIASAIMVIVIGTVIMLLISTTNYYEVVTGTTELQNMASKYMGDMVSGIRGSSRDMIVITNGGEGIRFAPVTGWNTAQDPPAPVYGNNQEYLWDKTNYSIKFTSNGVLIDDSIGKKLVRGLHFSTVTDQRYLIYLTLSRQEKDITNPEWLTQVLRRELFVIKYSTN